MQFERLTTKKAIYNSIESFSAEFPRLKRRVCLADYCDKLAKKSYTVLMKDEDKTIGLAGIYINDLQHKTAFITLIGVHFEYQGKGYGRILLQHCYKVAGTAGMNKIRLEVDDDNQQAKRLYSKEGFQLEHVSTNRNSSFMIKNVEDKLYE